MNIGVLFPRSNVYPLIGSEFTEGIKTYFRKEGIDKNIHLVMESIGFGAVEKEVYAKAEKLLMMDDVDILVGFIDEKILYLIKPLIAATGKLMIVVNAGANHPVNWVPQPNIVTLSLQHSFLCAVNGSDAATGEQGKSAALCSSFYDCGYLHIASLSNEFQASGGRITYNYINNQLYDDNFNISQLTDFLTENTGIQTLLCILDALPGSLFYKLLNQYSGAEKLKLFVSPMMLEKKALEALPESFHFSVQGYMPWHSSSPGENNKTFTVYYQQQLKKEPGIFSLLGWETGMVLHEINTHCPDFLRNGEAITEKIKTMSINSPRGQMQLDEASQYFLAPAIKCTANAGSSSVTMEYDVSLQQQWEEFSEKNTDGAVSGWTNTYLCY